MAHVAASSLRSAMNSIRLTGHLPIVFPHTIIYPLPRFLKLLISKPYFLCRPICSRALHSQSPLPSQGTPTFFSILFNYLAFPLVLLFRLFFQGTC